MDDKIDQLQKQLHPSKTPETRDDIDEWLEDRDEDNEDDEVDLLYLTKTPETEEEIEEWLNGSNDLE